MFSLSRYVLFPLLSLSPLSLSPVFLSLCLSPSLSRPLSLSLSLSLSLPLSPSLSLSTVYVPLKQKCPIKHHYDTSFENKRILVIEGIPQPEEPGALLLGLALALHLGPVLGETKGHTSHVTLSGPEDPRLSPEHLSSRHQHISDPAGGWQKVQQQSTLGFDWMVLQHNDTRMPRRDHPWWFPPPPLPRWKCTQPGERGG